MQLLSAILKPTRFRKIHRYVLLLIVLTVVYVMWPVQQIERLSDTLSVEEKNDYIDSILNPDSEALYHRNTGPLKADFNPSKQSLDVPTVIDVDNLNKALNKINMKPLSGDTQEKMSEKISVLSDAVTKRKFTPLNSLEGFIGNLATDKKTDYYKDLTCDMISYKPTSEERVIEYADPILLEDGMIEIRRWLLSSHYAEVLKAVQPSDSDGLLLSDISHWYKTSGSSVWLPDEQVHLVASTVLYAPEGPTEALASFIRLQLFDADWNEVKGRRIRYSDLSEAEIDDVLTEYSKTKEDRHLDRISFRFPSILSIPIDVKLGKGTIGPESPRVLYKDGEYHSEPVIIFNMLSGDKRNMFAVFPLRPPQGPKLLHPVVKFKNFGNNAHTMLKSEKNWIPFFDSLKIGDSKTSKGNMYFAYTLDPLVIFKCSLDTGKCAKVQDNMGFSKFAEQGTTYLRGGTSFTPVPRQIIQTLNDGDYQKRLQMWIGFPKFLIKVDQCGNIYRPTLTLLIKEDGVFRLELMTEPIDFGLPPAEECSKNGEPSIISAHGISFWDIAATGMQESDSTIPYYHDYMGIIVGESDTKIELIVLKNVLNYAMGVYSRGKYMFGEYDLEGGVAARTKKVCECVLGSGVKYAVARANSDRGRQMMDKSIEN